MDFTRTNFTGGFDPIWRGECKVLPGGYFITDELPAGAIVRRGTPVVISAGALECTIAKSATVVGGDGTEVHIAKGSLFVVGDTVAIPSEDNGAATTTTITAIDTTNSDYDVITVDTSVDAMYIYTDCTPNGIVCADYVNDGKGTPTLDIAYEAVVIYKGIINPIADAWYDGICMKGNPCIKLITQ